MHDVVENQVYSIDRAVVDVVPGPLAYAEQHAAAIAANWGREVAANPTLFNGELYLAPQTVLEAGVLRAGFVRSLYETLLYWRKDTQAKRPWHIFGVGVIVSAEGHLIAGRMASNSAGAGRIYFPAGSIDDHDIVDGRVDYEANMQREVFEETGVDLNLAIRDPHIQLVTGNRSVALFRRYRFHQSTDALVSSIRETLAAQAEPELDAILPIRSADDMGEATPSYVRAFAKWHFAT